MNQDPTERVRKKLGHRELLGQCFFLPIAGESIGAEERELIQTMRPGGFILFRRNLPSREASLALVSELTKAALKASRVPPLVAIDEEGGFVSQTDAFTIPTPSNMALASADEQVLVEGVGRGLGRRLRSLRVPLALAPVLDVNDCPENPVIGIRSFGSDAQCVSRWGRLAVESLQETGVFACGKHFPGHGSTQIDSHQTLPVLRHDKKRLRSVELRPFREALKGGLRVIMTAHVAYPEADPHGELPATLCPGMIRGMLRDDLGFDGLVVSDDLDMGAIKDNFSPREVARLGRAAGLDLFLFAQPTGRALNTWESALDQLEAGRIDREDLERSVARVLRLKADWLGFTASGRWGNPDKWAEKAGDWDEGEEELARLSRRTYRSAIAEIRHGEVSSWAPGPNDLVGVLITRGQAGGRELEPRRVVALLEEYSGRHEVVTVSPDPLAGELREFLMRAPAWDRILLVVLCRTRMPEGLRRMIRELARSVRPLALLSLLTPCSRSPFPGLTKHLVSFGFCEAALRAALDCLWDREPARGKLDLTES